MGDADVDPSDYFAGRAAGHKSDVIGQLHLFADASCHLRGRHRIAEFLAEARDRLGVIWADLAEDHRSAFAAVEHCPEFDLKKRVAGEFLIYEGVARGA